jgi:phosphomevalonate kinase
VGQILHDLRQVFLKGVRQGLKRMGELADVPLEPPEQTQLADATMDVKGCLIAGVPGGKQAYKRIRSVEKNKKCGKEKKRKEKKRKEKKRKEKRKEKKKGKEKKRKKGEGGPLRLPEQVVVFCFL